MIKENKKSKVILTLLIIIVLCFESLAAIVSDNDGSAFVTKAEFEALKNNFASQVDTYNTSIDNKIDGAISSYLAGINVQKEQSLYTVLRNWDIVTMRNYEFANQYAVPGTHASLSYYAAGHNANGTNWNMYPSAYGLAFVGSSSPAQSKIKSVLLLDGDESDYNDLTKNKFYWNGFITDYEERIAMSKLGYNDYQDPDAAYYNVKLGVYDALKLSTIENGYYDDMSNFWSERWKPLLQGQWENSAHGAVERNFNPTYSGGFFQWANSYSKENIENKYELTWNAVNMNVIDPDFTSSFFTFSNNPLTSKDMIDTMTINKAGTWIKLTANGWLPETAKGTRTSSGWDAGGEGTAWRKAYIESHYLPDELNAEIYDYTRGATSGGKYKIPTLGGLGPIGSDLIYLQNDNLSYYFKDRDYEKDITTMNEGFPLIYAKQGSELTWTCSFSDINGSSEVKNNGEAKVILSYGEFGDESESKDDKYVQADGTMGDTEYAFTSRNRTCKIKWTMQKDGWIYAKWFPAALTSSTAKDAENWYVTLDGTKSNKIIYVEKDQ